MTFPYLEYKGHKSPIVPLSLKGKSAWHLTTAYVDSGATYSVFKAEEAQRLPIKLENGKKEFVVVGDGSFIPIYLHNIKVKIGREKFDSVIAFSDRLGAGFNLLGRKGVFDKFDVTFSDSREKVIFTKRFS